MIGRYRLNKTQVSLPFRLRLNNKKKKTKCNKGFKIR